MTHPFSVCSIRVFVFPFAEVKSSIISKRKPAAAKGVSIQCTNLIVIIDVSKSTIILQYF